MRLIMLSSILVSLPVFAQTGTFQPEDTVSLVEKTQLVSGKEMVVAAHPLAVEVGAEILRDGGSAVAHPYDQCRHMSLQKSLKTLRFRAKNIGKYLNLMNYLVFKWCPGEDLNLHGVSPTST